jgi:tRNA (adenine57-N1/adenine58-N1)-methyltransferase
MAEAVFNQGDHALIVDRRGRRYLTQLVEAGVFESHIGRFDHKELIGLPVGSWMTTSKNHYVLAVKPTMADFTREMPRIATVVYPKDLGAIVIQGDIFPGARVLEAGSGSGALTIALLRAVGDKGHIYSYDVREDMLERTRKNVEDMIPDTKNLTLSHGDVSKNVNERDIDRIVLDLPEPWDAVKKLSEVLLPGGILLSFLPTVLQVHDLVHELRKNRTFEMIETIEVLTRDWEIRGRTIRPDHRMVAHTGFITTARMCIPRVQIQ